MSYGGSHVFLIRTLKPVFASTIYSASLTSCFLCRRVPSRLPETAKKYKTLAILQKASSSESLRDASKTKIKLQIMSDAPLKATQEAYDLGMKAINWVVIVEKICPALDV